uniref:Uncharacterized protein n=1 Tax=Siphoviridae sp. ctoRD1 TaxID=2825669 RepID=A0A8S5QE35_9CAUD|nr:MAG TPA: hypothetical protein [Siphoviridae sp. ctoRD1]DAW44428.1 MAG TPA: hypothetical protein [Caudoviricetes sp.]
MSGEDPTTTPWHRLFREHSSKDGCFFVCK